MGIFDKSNAGINGDTPLAKLGNAVASQGLSYARSQMSSNQLPLFDGATSLLNGDLNGAINSVLNKNVIDKGINKLLGNDDGRSAKSPLMAYLSFKEAQAIFEASHNIQHAYKNLWLLNITDYTPNALLNSVGDTLGVMAGDKLATMLPEQIGGSVSAVASQALQSTLNGIGAGFLNEQGGGVTSNFNLLATNISYTPFTIEADSFNVGSAVLDGAKSSAKSEITITFLDNEQGFIKKWFKRKASEIIHPDGTVGILSDGLINIRILHAFVSDNTNNGGFEETIICRPVGTEYELDRKDNGLQEITLRFEQIDTFIGY